MRWARHAAWTRDFSQKARRKETTLKT